LPGLPYNRLQLVSWHILVKIFYNYLTKAYRNKIPNAYVTQMVYVVLLIHLYKYLGTTRFLKFIFSQLIHVRIDELDFPS